MYTGESIVAMMRKGVEIFKTRETILKQFPLQITHFQQEYGQLRSDS